MRATWHTPLAGAVRATWRAVELHACGVGSGACMCARAASSAERACTRAHLIYIWNGTYITPNNSFFVMVPDASLSTRVRTWSPPCGPTGMTRRPGDASCATSASGRRGAAAPAVGEVEAESLGWSDDKNYVRKRGYEGGRGGTGLGGIHRCKCVSLTLRHRRTDVDGAVRRVLLHPLGAIAMLQDKAPAAEPRLLAVGSNVAQRRCSEIGVALNAYGNASGSNEGGECGCEEPTAAAEIEDTLSGQSVWLKELQSVSMHVRR